MRHAIAPLVIVAALVGGVVHAEDAPPVFRKLAFADAKAANAKDGKILIVKATAAWCQPCKLMDTTTWRDEKVVAWLNDKGVAITFDVDQQAELAQSLSIEAMPTMIAFKAGKEFDRLVGYQTSAQLLEWLRGVDAGETTAGRLRKRLEQARSGELKLGMQERYQLAEQLARAGEHVHAGEEYAWLWENMVAQDRAMVGVRNSFLVNSIQRLVAEHPEAGAKFRERRDACEARLKGASRTWDDLNDWLGLSAMLGEEDAIVAWFDRIKDDPDARATLDRFGTRVEPLLEARERFADLAKLCRDPRQKLRIEHDGLRETLKTIREQGPEDQRDSIIAFQAANFRRRTANMYAGLLIVHREADASAYAKEAMSLDPDPAMAVALISRALEQQQPREEHRAWLAQWAAKGQPIEGLGKYLDEALAATKK